jgi:hypothetical protein
MLYVQYDDDGRILSVTNEYDPAISSLEVDLETYEAFSNGTRMLAEYQVVEDYHQKGKMHLVNVNVEQDGYIDQEKGIVSKKDITKEGIIFEQLDKCWHIHNHLSGPIPTLINLGTDYFREYYIVEARNRFVLLDTIVIDMKELVNTDKLVVQGHSADKEVSIVCFESRLRHRHKVGKQNAYN